MVCERRGGKECESLLLDQALLAHGVGIGGTGGNLNTMAWAERWPVVENNY
ncbi:hypothetical protein GCM10027088_60360 [Nocardia goodfellowii]